jgi:iron(III) transport system ATP-binding protein
METRLGRLPQTLPLPPGTSVTVAARPDDIRLEVQEDGNASVVDKLFTGISFMYTLGLEDGTLLHSWQPHTLELAVGDRVQADFRPGHALPCYMDGLLVEELVKDE